jgi:glutamyl-tRNA reductase
MRLVVLGLNHRTAPLELREQVAFLDQDAVEALHELAARDEFAEVALLSTCNRTEVYAVTENPDAVDAAWRDLVKQRRGLDLAADTVYRHERRDCAVHLLRVASGIDSMVLGETGILGQVRDAHALASREETLGPLLGRLFPAALHAGKRARSETAIGQGAISHAKAGVTLAKKVFGDLVKRTVLVVGSGATGTLTASHLAEEGVTDLVFANRTAARAEELAKRHRGRAIPLEGVVEALSDVDVVVTAVGSQEPILTAAGAEAALDRRKTGRPLLVVDLGVPRNVEPALGEKQSVFLYAVDDLESLVSMNLERRKREIPKVEAIVEDEVERYREWLSSLGATPVLVEMRRHADALRIEALEKFGRTLSIEEKEQLDRFSKALMNKLLHDPTLAVRECDASTPKGLSQLSWTRRLFGLDPNRDGER